MNKFDLNTINLNMEAPEKEPERQYYFMAKCREIISKQAEELGRKPICVCKNFGWEMKQ